MGDRAVGVSLGKRPLAYAPVRHHPYFSFNNPYRFERRRRTIALFEALRRRRVDPPLVGLPVGLTG